MSFFSKVADVRRLALHNLFRQKTRNAIMSFVLALGITAFMVVIPVMDSLAERAVARTSPLKMPCDLALVVRHAVMYREEDLVDSSRSKVEVICPAHGTASLPWGELGSYYRGVEYATIEQVFTPAGLLDMLHGSPESDWFKKSVELQLGDAPRRESEVIVPRWFADKANIWPGTKITIIYPNAPMHQWNEKTFTVTGIFRTDFSLADVPIAYEPIVHAHDLADLGDLANRGKNARLLAMFDLSGLRPDLGAVRRTLETAFQDRNYTLGLIYGFTPDAPEHMARALVSDVQMPAVNALFLAFVFVAVGLFTVMLLSFLDRRRDIAIMKTVGISNNEVAAIIVAEIAIVTLVGVLLGAALSTAVVKSLSGTAWAGVLTVKWVNILKGASVGFLVMFLSALFPVNLARVATVNQLLYDQKIYLFHRRVMRTVKAPGSTPSAERPPAGP